MTETGLRRLKIAYVINDLKLGGAQMMILELATKLNKDRFSVKVYYLNSKNTDVGNLESEFAAAGIETKYIGTGGRTALFNAAYRLHKLWSVDLPDIVHAHLPYAVLASSIAAIPHFRIKLIAHEHQFLSHFSWKIRALRFVFRFRAILTICFSSAVENEIFRKVHSLIKEPSFLEGRSCTVTNGVDVAKITSLQTSESREYYRNEFRCKNEDILVLSVARFIDWKGQEVLVQAFIKLAEKIPQLRLCLVGSGPTETLLKQIVKQAALQDRVFFTGDRKDVLGILGAADIVSLVYSYKSGKKGDSVGIAGFEALASGLPLVAVAEQSLTPGLEDQTNILLVQPNSPQSLADTLRRLALDASFRKQIGYNAKLFAERNLDWSSIVPIYERIYSLVKKK